MLKKVPTKYVFKTKRDFNLITPCCNKKNSNGGFINYENLEKQYGYCHSCGTTMLPPATYQDNSNNQYVWNNSTSNFDQKLYTQPVLKSENKSLNPRKNIIKKSIPEKEIFKTYYSKSENNLLKYLRHKYGDKDFELVKEMYVLGTYKDGGTMFWMINKALEVQKLKVAYYDHCGKRKNKFKVPYKNEDGFFACLFGEHLLIDSCKKSQIIVLVESEKTAIVGAILLPKYTWLAYGGLNGLTEDKAQCLKGFSKVLVVPDFSSNAVGAINKRVETLSYQDIHIQIWDLSNNMTDQKMKDLNIYNNDLEDIFKNLESSVFNTLIR